MRQPKTSLREHATIIAALRYWQRDGLKNGHAEHDIANEAGTLNPLTAEEIDALVQRLNFGDGCMVEQNAAPDLQVLRPDHEEEVPPMPWCAFCGCWHGPEATHITVRTIIADLEGVKVEIYRNTKKLIRYLWDATKNEWVPGLIFAFDELDLATYNLNAENTTEIVAAVKALEG